MKRRTFWFVLAAAAVALGVGAQQYFPDFLPSGRSGQSANAATTPKVERPIAVEVERATISTVVEDIRAVGTLRPNESVVIAPEIAGRLSRIRFNEGDRVKTGDVLVEIDSVILKAELDKSRAEVALAKANNDRASTLAQQGTGTLRARDEAVAAFHAAQANLALAEARLEKATITAPLSGVMGLRAVSVGAYLTPGTPIVELADVATLKVDFRVPELRVASLRPGQAIVIAADALPDAAFEGTIYAIDPTVDVNGRAIRLRARVPNPDGRLSPGLFVRLQIIVERRAGAVLVPESAIFAEAGKTFVYRIVDNRAERIEVTLGQRRPGVVEVRNGLTGEDTVVTAGHQRLGAGAVVEILTARKPGV
ncbi:MAG: efflux RND transporter periplasmic adaptor subunit [Rhodospirillales bacterium]|nr:efflux RND transporter periplasmic adaptor subunit [Rhodospirillales bacterium]